MNEETSPQHVQSGTSHGSYMTSTAPRSRNTIATILITLFVGVPALMFWGMLLFLFAIIGALFSPSEEAPSCNVVEIPLHGIITSTGDGFSRILGLGTLSSADDFIHEIKTADSDDTIDAIIIDIDSPGGTPVAADEMMSALIETSKPVVAVIRGVGASAAYWVASGADHIIASPVSQVGSVGVTMSYLETASSTDIVGSRWIDISSGLYKDAGNPERALRDEEREHFRTQVAGVHDYMVTRIAEARPVFTREEVAQLADGRAYLGTEALRLKLVDALGGIKDAERWLAQTLGKEASEVVRCGQEGTVLDDLFR